MPPLPTILNTFRCTLNITSASKPSVHNTFHVRTAAAATGPAVAAALEAILVLPGVDNLIAGLTTDYSISSIDVLPLNGITAAAHELTGGSTPAGLQTGDIVPEAAVVMSFYSLLRGPAGRNRCFIGPLSESSIANGTVTAALITSMTAAWTSFRAEIALSALGMEKVVASYVHAIANDEESCLGKPFVGMQRRRLTRLR